MGTAPQHLFITATLSSLSVGPFSSRLYLSVTHSTVNNEDQEAGSIPAVLMVHRRIIYPLGKRRLRLITSGAHIVTVLLVKDLGHEL